MSSGEGGIENHAGLAEAVNQLRAVLSSDPNGATDDVTRSILEQLNKEVARLYEEESGEEDGEDDDDYTDDDGADGDEDGAEGSRRRAEARLVMPKGPRPYDLWRSSHNFDKPPKEKLMLSTHEWSDLVDRLNESARKRRMFLMQAQQKQMREELSGFTFMPHISERSKEIAANVKSLPERVAALMRKRKAKIDRIKHEKEDAELKEATFKPHLNTRRLKRQAQVGQDDEPHGRERIRHLLQYELDKRVRAEQRRILIQEMQEKDMTFVPNINKNSVRIVERLAKEREEKESLMESGAAATGLPMSPGSTTRAAAKRAVVAALAASAASGGNGGGLTLKGVGRSYLPGHEEETFHPRINSRSATLHRPGVDDQDVYSRLYVLRTKTTTNKERSKSPKAGKPASELTRARLENGDDAENDSSNRSTSPSRHNAPAPVLRDASGFPVDEFGEPAPGHPHYFNVIAYEGGAGKMDFLLKRLLGNSASAAAGGVSFLTSSGGVPTTSSDVTAAAVAAAAAASAALNLPSGSDMYASFAGLNGRS